MNTAAQMTIAIGAVCLAIATGLGAYAAHGLEAILDAESVATFGIGVEYQFYHGLGLLGLGLLRARHPDSIAYSIGTWLMLTGIILFCGSIYAGQFIELGFAGMAAPVGGLCLIAAWLAMALGASRTRSR